MKSQTIILILLFLLICISCSDEGICTDDITCRVNAGFYVRDSNGERDTVLNDLTLYGSLRPDSMIYNAAKGVQRIEFPLKNSTDSYSSFVFRVDTITDTINLYHKSKLVLVSFECGYTMTHDIFRTAHGNILIDTITIRDPLVDLWDEENLKIYIIPAVPDTAG